MKGSPVVAEKRGGVPIWLRRLDLGATQIRGERILSRGAGDRIDTVLSLMADGQASLNAGTGARKRRRGMGIRPIRPTARDRLLAFQSLDAEWVRRWNRERGKAFGR
jgi:hypothetical protein